MEIKSIEQIKDEVAIEHGWESFNRMLDYNNAGVISGFSFSDFWEDVCERHAQQFQHPTDVLTTEIMVLREKNAELVEMLKEAKSLIGKLRRSISVHPDCTIGSEFHDYTSTAQNLEDEIESLINSNITE